MAAVNFEADFHILSLPYKTLPPTPTTTTESTTLTAKILIPKSLTPSTPTPTTPTPTPTPLNKHPILVHIHGGALIVGTNPDPSITPHWMVQLALTTPAILISPAYRLLPESTGSELLSDIRDFWIWLNSESSFLFSNHPYLQTLYPDGTGIPIPDTSRIASAGESAGGFLSIQSGLLFNPSAKIRAVAASYPAQYPDVASYNPRAEEGKRDATQEAIVDAYMAKVAERKLPVRISSPWPEGRELVMAMVQTGRHREMMGEEKGLTLRGALDGAVDGEVPAIWVIQGDEDDLVPKSAADVVVDSIRTKLPRTPLKYTVEPGGHLFDQYCGLEEPWVKEGLEFFKKHWL